LQHGIGFIKTFLSKQIGQSVRQDTGLSLPDSGGTQHKQPLPFPRITQKHESPLFPIQALKKLKI